MLSKASEAQLANDTSWPLTPLFFAISIGITSYALRFVAFDGMAIVILLSLAVFLLIERTDIIRRRYNTWQSVMMMVASGQIGMCIGAWFEFGPLGLLTKYQVCANIPGYGIDLVYQTLTISPLTHLGMFLGCAFAAILVDPGLLRKSQKLISVMVQTSIFILIAIMVSKWTSIFGIQQPYTSYVLQLIAMHATMSLCMITLKLAFKAKTDPLRRK